MNQDMDRFCVWAVNRGMLSQSQSAVLREICRPAASLDEFIALIEGCDIVGDLAPLRQLKEEMAAGLPADPTAAAKREERAEPARNLPLDLRWFRHFCLAEKMLSQKDCDSILSNVEGATRLIRFAQILIDTGLCGEHEKIRGFVGKATEQAATGEAPPAVT